MPAASATVTVFVVCVRRDDVLAAPSGCAVSCVPTARNTQQGLKVYLHARLCPVAPVSVSNTYFFVFDYIQIGRKAYKTAAKAKKRKL